MDSREHERGTRALANNEVGSIMLLTIGYVVLALAVIFVCASATDLYITQKRLDATADAAALAGADGFTLALVGGAPVARLTDADVEEQAAALVLATAPSVTVIEAAALDDTSARVTVALSWQPPLVSIFVPEGVLLTSTATSRSAFLG